MASYCESITVPYGYPVFDARRVVTTTQSACKPTCVLFRIMWPRSHATHLVLRSRSSLADANYSWLIKATYDKPVNPDIPREFVLKQVNQAFLPNFPPGTPMRVLANRSYELEAYWYDNIRDHLPIPQPKGYWTGVEPPADRLNDMGTYGVLMEYVNCPTV